MKSPPFEYDAPATVDEALELLAEHGDDAKVLAGGQSLVPLMALRLARPSRLIDVCRIPELEKVQANGVLTIGATVRQRAAERSAVVAQRCPAMVAALPFVGHLPIRTRGTVGGSLSHADPAAELPAVALLTDAELVARRRGGERAIAAADFFQGFLETALEPDELLVQVRVPSPPARSGVAFDEVARRYGDFALVGAGAVVALDDDGSIAHVRLACTGVSGTPQRFQAAEALLVGEVPSPALFAAGVDEVRRALDPPDDLHASAAYRRHVAGVLAMRVLERAAANAADVTGGRTG